MCSTFLESGFKSSPFHTVIRIHHISLSYYISVFPSHFIHGANVNVIVPAARFKVDRAGLNYLLTGLVRMALGLIGTYAHREV